MDNPDAVVWHDAEDLWQITSPISKPALSRYSPAVNVPLHVVERANIAEGEAIQTQVQWVAPVPFDTISPTLLTPYFLANLPAQKPFESTLMPALGITNRAAAMPLVNCFNEAFTRYDMLALYAKAWWHILTNHMLATTDTAVGAAPALARCTHIGLAWSRCRCSCNSSS